MVGFLAEDARAAGYVITAEMEQEAVRRIRSGEASFWGPEDEDDPETARPGQWETN